MSNKNTLVFDIETIGKDFKELDEISQEHLLKYAQDEEEEEQIKGYTGFYPLTGEIVAIGVMNPDTNQGGIFVRNEKNIKLPDTLEESITIEQGSEKEILQKFWTSIRPYAQFVSFNGRGFDVPYLMIRSAIHEIRPSKDLMSNRYINSQKESAKHIDLYDQLSFYGTMRRKFNLHMWCKAFGIESPKEQGITGNDVQELYDKGELETIARYNLRDLRSTAQLYEKWNTYLRM